jgi:ATP-dependent helicase/nuclease subunit A
MTQAAYQANAQPTSRTAFYALACDPARSVVVEACAGAGKTWMLVSRILRALLEGAAPQEVLAITFTRKAAGEMRERLNDWLCEFAAPHTLQADRVQALVDRGLSSESAQRLAPELAGLHERLLCTGRAVEIRTFHAWFAQLLRAAPLALLNELGLQPDMELIEDVADHRVAVFRRFHAAVLRQPALRAQHAELIAQRGRSQTRAWLEAAWDKRVEVELADAAGTLANSVPAPDVTSGDHPAQPLLGAAWSDTLRELMLELGQGKVKAQDAATGLVMALAQKTDAKARFDHAWSSLFTKQDTPRKQLGKVLDLETVQNELEAVAQQVRQHDAHLEHRRMVALARTLLAEYASYKREHRLADMADLERCGLTLLRDATLAGWVQERLDARIRHVLIDEFQDTSPLQWHALHAWLSAYAGAGGGASGQKPPGVFIVGDPKQSIYRFRRAEPRVFEAAQTFVVQALGGTLLACDHTRRNAPEVLQPLNEVFAQAQAAGQFSGFRAHSTELSNSQPGDSASGNSGIYLLPKILRPPRATRSTESPPEEWRDSLTTPRLEAETLLREQEAAVVAQAVHELVTQQGVAPGDIFILSRKRQSLRLAAQALQSKHLPYAAVEDFELMACPEARDMVALLEVLASPQHNLALAQVLRCPLFGASDADLVSLALRVADCLAKDSAEFEGASTWWRALTTANHASPALQRASHLLQNWRQAAAQLPPHDLLDRIVHQGEWRERVAATVPPEQRLAALGAMDAVLHQALTLDSARYATPYNLVRALKRRAITVAAPAQANAVQLLTVHGAKGLEARVVFVMDADPQPKNADTATLLIDWPVDADHPLRCAFVYAETACPPSLASLLAEEVQARAREELNGLYVAMTRAKQRLVFSATQPTRQAQAASWWARVEPLGVAWAPDSGENVTNQSQEAALIAFKTMPAVATPPQTQSTVEKPTQSSPQEAARLGQAVHRVLEWATATPSPDLQHLAHAAALEFDAPLDAVNHHAQAIWLSPSCVPFFSGPQLQWAGNEVPVSDAGELLRIDRLVCFKPQASEPATWWVLDYKLHPAPQQQPDYCEQLRRYRQAVQNAQPGDAVRCAFINGAGSVVEIT